MTDLEYWLWFTLAFGPANPRKWNVLEHYESLGNCYESITGGDLSRVLPKDVRSVKSATLDRVHQLIEICQKNNINICTYDDELYPQRLREIYNSPSVLFYIGDISGIDDNLVISAVGTRTPSEYSVNISEKLCAELAHNGVRIVSGIAVGLDSVVHRSVIRAGGRSYSVLPCGILCDHPAENAKSKDVIAKRGAVISEYFPSDKPSSINFRARNRIISGIGLGTLVLQAGARSGALSTASFAVSQGRDIFCIPPHDIYDSAYAGVIPLIRSGATPVFDASDIINSYKLSHSHILAVNTEFIKPIEGADEVKDVKPLPKQPKTAEEPALDRAPHIPKNLVKTPVIPQEELSGTKKAIYDYLKEHGATHLDELAVGIGDVFELEAYLTELELDGLVKSLPGNRFSI